MKYTLYAQNINYTCILHAQEDEFKLCVNTAGLQLVPQGVLVVWEWEWHSTSRGSNGSSSDASDDEAHGHHNPYMQSDSDDEPEMLPPHTLPSHTHVVTFKCMGTTYSLESQETSKKAGQFTHQSS